MKSTPAINIWIHGTNLQQLLPGKLSDIQIEPFHKFMYCEPGLHKAQHLDSSFHHHQIAMALHESAPQQFTMETLYLFGWSGKLNPTERFKEAQKLYKALKKVTVEFEQAYHQKPYIRIIAHSHGGNVALHLAQINNNKEIIINELILLACPVQTLTAPFINDSMFRQVYSLHSHWDFTQIADPQGWPSVKEQFKKFFQHGNLEQLKKACIRSEEEPFFSERHFNNAANLVQVVVTKQGQHLAHIQFMLKPFVQKLPYIINFLDNLSPKEKQEFDLEIDIINDQIL